MKSRGDCTTIMPRRNVAVLTYRTALHLIPVKERNHLVLNGTVVTGYEALATPSTLRHP
jgi:hypothetical protein